jgi:valyl-tRNA synthetase
LVDGEIKLHPKRFEKYLRTLVKQYSRLEYFSSIMVGTANTCLFHGDEEDFVVAESIEEALELAKIKTNNQNLTTKTNQDVDALDTWFLHGYGHVRFWWNNGSRK